MNIPRLMRSTLLISTLSILALLGCKNEQKPEAERPVQGPSINPYNGVWASIKYIHVLTNTHSPLQAQDEDYFMKFPSLLKDTCVSFTFHEGGGHYVTLENKGRYYLRQIDGDTALQAITAIESGKTLRIGNDTFCKVADADRVAEALLFSGTYNYNGKIVDMTADGHINGLDSLQYYNIETDYIGPGLGDLDIIYLGKTEQEHQTHGFEIHGDTLLIYRIECKEMAEDGTCINIKKGRLRYKLVKK